MVQVSQKSLNASVSSGDNLGSGRAVVQQHGNNNIRAIIIRGRVLCFGIGLLLGGGIVVGSIGLNDIKGALLIRKGRETTTDTTPVVSAPNNNSSLFWQPKSNATTQCDEKYATIGPIDASQFHSKGGEDKKLMELFFGTHDKRDSMRCGGTYVELGALDGSELSHSWVFHENLDWRGVLIELGPDMYRSVKKNRDQELAVVHAGVCGKQPRKVRYIEKHAVGGIVDYAPKAFREHWWANERPDRFLEIECRPLNDVLKEAVGSETYYFDFFSMSVTGAEYDVIGGVDFYRYKFGIILVEANHYDPAKNMAVRNHLVRNGYSFHSQTGTTDWFMNDDFYAIYPHLAPKQQQ